MRAVNVTVATRAGTAIGKKFPLSLKGVNVDTNFFFI